MTELNSGRVFELVALNALVETHMGEVVRSTNSVPTRTAGNTLTPCKFAVEMKWKMPLVS